VQLDYSAENWGLGSRIRFADRQDRIDDLSKQEVGETAGWAVLDVYGNYRFNNTFSLRVGADNLLDKTYAEHSSRSNLLDPVAIKVNEPGRVVWLKMTAEF
ncbi:MAG TPA: TonB-dependent receptor, partial [Thiotrichales bacterium]|nr:TonB-dependent receptor [Thiotrichales bacterium]